MRPLKSDSRFRGNDAMQALRNYARFDSFRSGPGHDDAHEEVQRGRRPLLQTNPSIKTPAPVRGPAPGKAGHHARQGTSVYLVMSTFLVSFRKNVPMTRVISAMPIGYHKPKYRLPVPATRAKEIAGKKPPNQPLPMWYGSDMEV